jgi:hypothetical protein
MSKEFKMKCGCGGIDCDKEFDVHESPYLTGYVFIGINCEGMYIKKEDIDLLVVKLNNLLENMD